MNVTINTDLSVTGTKISIDGKDISDSEDVIGIRFIALSPIKDSDYDIGYISVDVTTLDKEGNTKRTSYNKDEWNSNKAPMGVELSDFISNIQTDNIIRCLGQKADTNVVKLADSISEYCINNKIKCPDKDILYNRSISSLKDKAEDLGLEIK